MKLSLYTASFYLSLIILTFADFSSDVTAVQLEKVGETSLLQKMELEKHRHKHKTHKKNKAKATAAAAKGKAKKKKNETIANITYKQLNDTYAIMPQNSFVDTRHKWDYKLLLRQLDDIWGQTLWKGKKQLDEHAQRGYLDIFINNFEKCDTNKDNLLTEKEFTACMTSDQFLSKIIVPNKHYGFIDLYTKKATFYKFMFQTLDTNHYNTTNFHDYMFLRLMVYSWQECSVVAPFIEEVAFECAINIISGTKTLDRSTIRSIYYLGLELGNNPYLRNMDFSTYLMIAQSVRLYGKINANQDTDLTRTEFTMALENNVLPLRFNQFTMEQFIQLTVEKNMQDPNFLYDYNPGQNIDIQTFVFLDFFLRLYDLQNPTRRYFLNKKDFIKVISGPLFPNKTKEEIFKVPDYNITTKDYNFFMYHNISRYDDEKDFLYKAFLETKSTVLADKKTGSKGKNISLVGGKIFNVLDYKSDGWIDFKDFGNFVQIAFLYSRFDIYSKGKITAGKIHDKYSHYSDFPRIARLMRVRSQRFSIFPEDMYFNLFATTVVLRFDYIMKVWIRESEPTTINEPELKTILKKISMEFVPNGPLNKCNHGVDKNRIPKYDWDCAFNVAITSTNEYYEWADNLHLVKNGTLKMVNTEFDNIPAKLNKTSKSKGKS